MTPASVEWREALVRPGVSSSLVAAEKVGQKLGGSPSLQQVESWGAVIHFGIGIAWGPIYGLLRRYVGLRPFGAALTSGVAMSLILDEGLVPVLGLSAPNRHYLPLPVCGDFLLTSFMGRQWGWRLKGSVAWRTCPLNLGFRLFKHMLAALARSRVAPSRDRRRHARHQGYCRK